MSEKTVVDAPTFANIMGQLGPLIATNRWPLTPPPANMMRGVDFYNATDFVSAFVLSIVDFKRVHGYLPQLASPTSFNEHILARKFFAPLPMPSLADKLGVREYVRERLGESALIPVVWVGDRVDPLFEAKLPAGRFVLKANHGSRMNLFLDLPQDLATRPDEIQSQAREWLAARFGYNTGEWQYSTIKPRLFLESFLGQDGNNDPMVEFKLHCFHGKTQLIQVISGRFSRPILGHHLPDWTYLAVGMPGYDPVEFARPSNISTLIESAERLARGLDYARIDLYSDSDQIVKFGEITLTPGDALQPFPDVAFERWLGAFFARTAGE